MRNDFEDCAGPDDPFMDEGFSWSFYGPDEWEDDFPEDYYRDDWDEFDDIDNWE